MRSYNQNKHVPQGSIAGAVDQSARHWHTPGPMNEVKNVARKSRAGFSISAFSLLMLLVFLAVAAAQLWLESGRPGFGVALVTIFLATPIVLALIVAALAYLVFGKSDTAGNGGFTAILLIATVGRLAYMTGMIPKGTSSRTLLRGGAGTPLNQGTRPSATPTQPPLTTAQAAGQPRPTPAASNSPALRQAPVNAAGPAPRTAVPAATSNPDPAAETAAIKVVLDQLGKDLDTEAGALSLAAEQVMDEAERPPRAERRAVEQRLQNAAALKQRAAVLQEKFDGLQEEAQKRLADVGITKDTAFSASVRYSIEAKGMWRSGACRDYASMCDAVADESLYLRDNLGKWTVDAKGEVTSKDLMVKGRAQGLRMMVESYTRRRSDIADHLRGK